MSSRGWHRTGIVGVSDHCGWAVLMTVAADGSVIDRRRIELVDEGLPMLPYHHDAQLLAIDEAVALIARVRQSAEARAVAGLEALARELPAKIAGISMRVCPPIPDSVEERLSSYRAQNVADTVMYRDALALAARERGWGVHWYDARRVHSDAARALGRPTIDDLLVKTRAALGPPWHKDHRMAMAAAIAAAASTSGRAPARKPRV